MNRSELLPLLNEPQSIWDVIVIGGGATGLGAALDAVTRGYKTLLLEQADFAKGTSSRSTKLIHGGVRYLKQGDVSLVLEALHERGILRQNAPHLVKNLAFVIPTYDWWGGPFYNIGMKVYDALAGSMGLGPSRSLSREEVMQAIPNVEVNGLRGGVLYYDGQFDDARLAVNLAQTVYQFGGTPLNYMKVTGLVKNEGLVEGVTAIDRESGDEYHLKARAVVNATGIFADAILKMDNPNTVNTLQPSQGIHLVLDKKFLQSESAIMVPKTDDGRVLFAVPWHEHVIVGTTDTLIPDASLEPSALEEEIDFVLRNAAKYLNIPPQRSDVLSIFAGLRPLVASTQEDKNTKEISRSHKVTVAESGLITVLGGKWTTFRKMGEDVVDTVAMVANLPEKECITKNVLIHGYERKQDETNPLHIYGSDAFKIKALSREHPELGEVLHPSLPYTKAEVVWSVRHEMARTVEDILARRQRALFLNARAAMEMAPKVAELMREELNKDATWVKNQLTEFNQIAKKYLLEE
ncbi:glycerol-3-phosphate dehydrogenase/oxidase [Rapidithrix thailandica]|uniref:Glycerol-3-phosphate dehydrogenase/oxidase n=1 Tax=Rapidithrix thailandica TaxID=413964 RepID=A0AAW9SEA7_9BACT